MTPHRRLSCIVAALILTNLAQPNECVYAQVLETKELVGVTGAWASDEAQRPERFNYEPAHAVWSLQGSLFVAPRVGFGAEWAHLGRIEAPGGSPRAQILESHRPHEHRFAPLEHSTDTADQVDRSAPPAHHPRSRSDEQGMAVMHLRRRPSYWVGRK